MKTFSEFFDQKIGMGNNPANPTNPNSSNSPINNNKIDPGALQIIKKSPDLSLKNLRNSAKQALTTQPTPATMKAVADLRNSGLI